MATYRVWRAILPNPLKGTQVILKKDNVAVPLAKSLRVWNHSPTGFEYGYGGSGPAQLALAILLEEFPEDEAISLSQRFKCDYIAKLNGPFTITSKEIQKWAEYVKKEQERA